MVAADPFGISSRPAAASALLGITPRTLDNWADAGIVRHLVTPGGQRRYPPLDTTSKRGRCPGEDRTPLQRLITGCEPLMELQSRQRTIQGEPVRDGANLLYYKVSKGIFVRFIRERELRGLRSCTSSCVALASTTGTSTGRANSPRRGTSTRRSEAE